MDRARLGLPGRDEEIEHFCTLIRNMGRLGIPMLCYNWMACVNWTRTTVSARGRGDALVTGFRPGRHAGRADLGRRRAGRAALGRLRVLPRAGRAGRREGGRAARPASRRSADPAAARREPHHDQRRGIRARARAGRQRGQRDLPLPGQLHAVLRRPARRDPALRQRGTHRLRALPRRARHADRLRGDLPRRGQDRHAGLHGGLARLRLRRRAAARPRADAGRRAERRPVVCAARPPARDRLHAGTARGRGGAGGRRPREHAASRRDEGRARRRRRHRPPRGRRLARRARLLRHRGWRAVAHRSGERLHRGREPARRIPARPRLRRRRQLRRLRRRGGQARPRRPGRLVGDAARFRRGPQARFAQLPGLRERRHALGDGVRLGLDERRRLSLPRRRPAARPRSPTRPAGGSRTASRWRRTRAVSTSSSRAGRASPATRCATVSSASARRRCRCP